MWNKTKVLLRIVNTNLDKTKYEIYVLLNIASTLVSLWCIVILGKVVNLVFTSCELPWDLVVQYVIASFAIQTASVVMNHINNDIDVKVSVGIERYCLKKMYGTSYLRFHNQDPSDITQKINFDSCNISGTVLFETIEFLKDLTTIVVCVIAIFLISPVYMAVVVSFAIANVLIYVLLKRKLYLIDMAVQEKNMRLFSEFYRTISKMKSIRNGGLRGECARKIDNSYGELWKERKRFIHLENIYSVLKGTTSVAFQIGILVFGVYGLRKGVVDLSSWIIITTYFSYINQSVINALEAGKKYLKLKISINRLWKYISLPQIQTGDKELNDCNKISFEEMKFSYPNTEKCISINCNLEQGKVYWIKGKNGTGKTTMINLLAGLYGTDYVGHIKFDEYEQGEINIDEFLKNRVLIVEQFPFIFADSMSDYFGCNDTSRIKKELHAYKLDAEIINEKFQNGTIDAEISGGEKQKLEIVRAMLSDKKIFVFDEITASLDQTSRNKFYEEIQEKRDNRIIMMISHEEPQYYDEVINFG